ncbi:GTP-binding protein [Leeia sp. TBRC 13508]|uniref:GTP-binding protein n=1 Tax=Leeia speluncae TaxID=2884804 RepID=A0ABS8D7G5_9NEIS|nr:GTP-binding protein [Leeia speluncae]MCB6184149.1 GTP-binding protein [Leeia speluncae]
MQNPSSIPVTIVTGFLGAGKTTLLNRVLKENHGQRIAVIENEFGEVGIDNELLVQDSEQIVEMNNGCICCTIRGDLQRNLLELAGKRATGQLAFDRILIETTGLADPGPVAQTFFFDEEVQRLYHLDAVLTVVDAKHGDLQLDREETAQKQVAFADRILLSKTDLVEGDVTQALEKRLLRINPRAQIRHVHFGETPLDQILDIQGFDLKAKLEINPKFLEMEAHDHDHHDHECNEHCDHDHGHEHHHHHDHDHECNEHCDHDHDHGHAHTHLDAVQSFVFRSERAFEMGKLEACLGKLLEIYGNDLYRYKGLLYLAKEPRQVIFQGVHMMMSSDFGRRWNDGEKKSSIVVFIGRDLPKDIFEQELTRCLLPAKK